jgi:outer membrane protein OmpA-like peptidoglycan-associated protein
MEEYMACRPHHWLWGLPLLAAIGCAGYALKKDMIEADLTARATKIAQEGVGGTIDGKPWAKVSLSGRDVLLAGVAPSQAAIDAATNKIQNAFGVRLVENQSTLLAEVKPFSWSASKEGNALNLAGAVGPDGERGKFATLAGAAWAGVNLKDSAITARGVPECALAVGSFGLAQLVSFINGKAELKDCALSISGNVADMAAKAKIEAALKTLPAGISLAQVNITAPAPPPPPPPPTPAPVVVAPPAPPAPAVNVVVPQLPIPNVVVQVPVAPAPTPAPVAPPVAAPKPIDHAALCTASIETARSGKWPLFALASHALTGENLAIVEKIAASMAKCHESVKFQLVGHTDNRAGNAYNQALSERRVNSVAAIIGKAKIADTRLAKGAAGEDKPVKPNDTSANMAQNRRVEILAK